MDESELVELPATQASKTSFPPGCRVWIHSSDLAPASAPSAWDYDAREHAAAAWDCEVREGTVRVACLGDVFSASRTFYYKVEVDGGDTEVVEESKLSFARNAPITLTLSGLESSDDSSRADQTGEILACQCFRVEDSGEVEIAYAVILFAEDGKLTVKGGVRPGQLRFRPEGLASVASSQTSRASSIEGQCSPPDIESSAKTRDQPRAFPANDTVRATRRVYKRSRGRGRGKSISDNLMAGKKIQIPLWMTSSDSAYQQVVETLTNSILNIVETSGCDIAIEEMTFDNKKCICLKLNEQTERDERTERQHCSKKAIELVENCLVNIVGAEESRGRLLHDMALAYAESFRRHGIVLQRSPLDSVQRVWMGVVDLPTDVEGDFKYTRTNRLDGKIYDMIHEVNCSVKLCQENFGIKLFRCQPYALVFGRRLEDVGQAMVIAKKALKEKNVQHTTAEIGTAAEDIPVNKWLNENLLPHSQSTGLSDSSAGGKTTRYRSRPRQRDAKPRVVTIPLWLLSDANFQQQIEDGLFGNEWYNTNEVGKKTGCMILLSQNNLIITPCAEQEDGQSEPSVRKATSLLEDTLVGLVGAQESKCKLIYDLTKSYSPVSPEGIVQMRNPLDSFRMICVSLMKVPVSHINEEGDEKYIFRPFLSAQNEDQFHKLKCTVKLCADNFGIELRHCAPYAIVLGHQKNNVAKAVEIIRKNIRYVQRIMASP
ncbi:hypothetical protein ACHAWF_011957 [Thalassiosira exigua]